MVAKRKIRKVFQGIAPGCRVDWSDFDEEVECSLFTKLRAGAFDLHLEVQLVVDGMLLFGYLTRKGGDPLDPIETFGVERNIMVTWDNVDDDPKMAGYDLRCCMHAELDEFLETVRAIPMCCDVRVIPDSECRAD